MAWKPVTGSTPGGEVSDNRPLREDVLLAANLLGAHWFTSLSVTRGPGHGGRRQLAGQYAGLLGWVVLGYRLCPRSCCPFPQPPRPCEVYRAEWELCRSAGHILHHYYVHGERPDCRQWLRDLASCREWEESHSPQAQVRSGCGCVHRSFGDIPLVLCS